jgi:hypothetical protein
MQDKDLHVFPYIGFQTTHDTELDAIDGRNRIERLARTAENNSKPSPH